MSMGTIQLQTCLVLFLILPKLYLCSGSYRELIQVKILPPSVAKGLTNLWTWIRNQSKSDGTFVGRCAQGIKKLGMALNFIVFKLGIIITALAFIGALVLKGLALGVVVLVVSSVGLFAKFAPYKYGGGGYESHRPTAIHFHVHNKDPHILDHHEYPLDSRLDEDKLELNDLYTRVGLSNDLYGSTYLHKDAYR